MGSRADQHYRHMNSWLIPCRKTTFKLLYSQSVRRHLRPSIIFRCNAPALFFIILSFTWELGIILINSWALFAMLQILRKEVMVMKSNKMINYRVSHETWQLVNGIECLLPYIIVDIKDFIQFISLTNSFTQIYFTLKSIFYKMTAMLYFFLFSFISQN